MSLLELALTDLTTSVLASENRKLVRGTVARFVMFGRYWRKGLERKVSGRAKHNAWTDVCYGTLEPSRMQMTKVPALLGVLEQMETDINSPLGGVDAITPTDLEAAIDALPPKWMVWEDLILTHDHIQTNVFKNKMTPFADKMYYP